MDSGRGRFVKSSRETIIKNIICITLVCAIGIVRLNL
ncbi:unknown [Eubacterium sp. CAG:161]|nr:unknown [Eubacterium sp. CAG:161]